MFKLPDGRYRVQVWVGGRRMSHTFARKEDAEKKERELKRAQDLVRAGMAQPKGSTIFFDYAGGWMRKRVKSMPRSTSAMDESRLRLYLLPRLASLPLQAITTQLIRDLLDEIQENPKRFNPKDRKGELSNATRNRIRALLHTMFQDAFMDELIVFNPVSRVPLLLEKKNTKPALTGEEQEKLIAEAERRGTMETLLVCLLSIQGRRVSEAVAVQVRDFDLKTHDLHIRRLYEQESGEIQDRIKGRPEGLVIPLFPRTAAAFRKRLEASPFQGAQDFCVCDEQGRPISTYKARDLVESISVAAGIRKITPHVLRATFATLAEEAGYSKEDIQVMLGHSTVQVTQRYTRRTAKPLLEKGKKLGFGSEGSTE